MPVRVRKRRKGESGKPFKIVETRGGAVKGESASRVKAEASVRVRNQADREKRRGGRISQARRRRR